MSFKEPATCTLSSLKLQKEIIRKKLFCFEYKGMHEFDTSSASSVNNDHVVDSDTTHQVQQERDAQNEEPEDGIQTLLVKHRILIIHFKSGIWGDWDADLVAVTELPAAENIIAPRLVMVVKCMIMRNGGFTMGLSHVGYFLPNSTVARHRSSGICFWYDPFSIKVLDRSKPATKTLSWPVYHTDHQEAAGSSVAPEYLPIRLIDIQGTLNSNGGIHFIKPTSWSFHILSHTWSKGVRNFSIAVGRKVSSAASYNEAFDNANFLEDPSKEAQDCYGHFMDLLTLLQEDGVNAVWFDALCINQTDKEEKEREIARMGEYYSYNLGCYVLPHGVGMGFTLWAPNDIKVKLPAQGKCALLDQKFQEKPALPRWFHRVWTFQEFVLPQKLMFIVAGLAKVTVGRVNKFIRRGGGLGLCMCGLPPRHLQFRYSDISLHMADEEEDIICPEQGSRDVCNKCGHVPFIRKLSTLNKHAYVVDREAYCFLCQLDLGPSAQWNIKFMPTDPEFVLWSLNSLAFAWHGLRKRVIATTLSMIWDRDCTNEEDRVLGMLGLLRQEMKGQLQVRVGISLHAQMWHLPKTVGPSLFLKLCMMDVEGYPAVGMSWAPRLDKWLHPQASLTGLKGDLNRPLLDTSHVMQVFEEGPSQGIFVVASIISGQLIPEEEMTLCNRYDPQSNSMQRIFRLYEDDLHKFEAIFVEQDDVGVTFGEGSSCLECVYHSPMCKHLIRRCKLVVESAKCGPLEIPLAAHEGGCSNRSVVRICRAEGGGLPANINAATDADVRILLPGVVSISTLKPFPVQLVRLVATPENVFGLVCIARMDDHNREVLHKIGTFSCALLESWNLQDHESSFVMQDPGFPQIRKEVMARDPLFPIGNRSCLIGGFGNDISKYVCS